MKIESSTTTTSEIVHPSSISLDKVANEIVRNEELREKDMYELVKNLQVHECRKSYCLRERGGHGAKYNTNNNKRNRNRNRNDNNQGTSNSFFITLLL